MLKTVVIFVSLSFFQIANIIAADTVVVYRHGENSLDQAVKVSRSDAEWKKILTRSQYKVLRKNGTEAPFSSELLTEKRSGVFQCAACHNDLFLSETKYESGTGWPSYWEPIHPNNVALHSDQTFGMKRVEVVCALCDSHLGHVFDDGPKPTGKRYCMNGDAMIFKANTQHSSK